MNYRHHFHAGNFADVVKHVVLGQLCRAMQRKEKPFLALDTHAGRGSYDLTAASTGDSLARRPEWPEGIGRLTAGPELPAAVADYLAAVAEVNGGAGQPLRHYPGSPRLLRHWLRPQDRMVCCELHPEEFDHLRREVGWAARTSAQEMDGYAALRAHLPPPERRALVLIDPPFEAQDEFGQVAAGLEEALRRMPSAVVAVWHPLTVRARTDAFLQAVVALRPPPTLHLEVMIAPETSAIRMRGCGMLVINPPWQFADAAASALGWLAPRLAQESGGGFRSTWLVPEA